MIGVGAGPAYPPARASLAGLVWTLVRTDFKARYHGTLGGFLWALLKPFAIFVVLLSVFSFVFASDPHYRLNLILGLFLWEFFAEATRVGLVSLHARGYLLTKARTPAWILVATSASNALVTLLAASLIIGVFLGFAGRAPSAIAAGLYLVYVLHYLVIVVGISLATSVLFLRYRDLNQVWEVVTQAGFFLAPVVYPLDILPPEVHTVLYLWPPTPVIQLARALLVRDQVPTLLAHGLLTVGTVVVFGAGALVFRQYAPRAAEYL